MSDYPKADWGGHVIDGGWDTRHARPAGEVTTPDLVADVAVDALVVALERAKKAEARAKKAEAEVVDLRAWVARRHAEVREMHGLAYLIEPPVVGVHRVAELLDEFDALPLMPADEIGGAR